MAVSAKGRDAMNATLAFGPIDAAQAHERQSVAVAEVSA
jgi:hypothetical protein